MRVSEEEREGQTDGWREGNPTRDRGHLEREAEMEACLEEVVEEY